LNEAADTAEEAAEVPVRSQYPSWPGMTGLSPFPRLIDQRPNVFPIEAPSLRERPEDIPGLALYLA
jgi:hypothetical protein